VMLVFPVWLDLSGIISHILEYWVTGTEGPNLSLPASFFLNFY
jgi:hypothetical protein